MKLPLLALLGMLTAGCGHVRTIYVTPAPAPVVVEQPPAYSYIQYHYVYVKSRWVRRAGPPPAGVRYHRHPRYRHSVVVYRSTSTRKPVTRSVRRPATRSSYRPPAHKPKRTYRRTTNNRHTHTKNCRHHRSKRRR